MTTLGTTTKSPPRDRVLPMHLNAAEHLWLAQDLPGYPSTFVIQLEFNGQIDRPVWEDSLGEALDRHPLLRAYIRPGKQDRPCWQAAPEQLPPIDWSAEGAPIICPRGEAIDLAHETALRMWVRIGVDRVRILLQFHHAACDGTGAYRFIGDLLATYADRIEENSFRPTLAPVRLPLLRSRTERLLGSRPVGWRAGLALGYRVVFRHPVPLAAPSEGRSDSSADDFPGFLSQLLDRAAATELRSAADARGATLNDLLLRDLFLTMREWNERHGSKSRQRFAIMMPTDMRDSQDCEMPAANLTSYNFLSRDSRSFDKPDDLLASIQAETSRIKSDRLGTKFMSAVNWMSRKSKLLPFVASRNVCLATAVLSNAADPSRRFTAKFRREAGRIVAGDLVLESITGVPPLRPKTRATFSISQYQRRLTVSLRCDPSCFTLEDAAALLNLYMERIRKSAAVPTNRD
ncbi:MAG TPA: hypothetical protein VH107_06210 [Lacipirellulaceae bacterium]|jgi:hypothetical protein|nr:hypothetical protein [Lacipirellulaceae bacterium]